MIENFREISAGKSVLMKQMFGSEDELSKHIENYLTDEYDSLVVLKFREHLPEITTIWQNLYLLGLLQEEATKSENPDVEVELPFKLVGFRDNDWYIEVLAALGGLGGLAAVIQLIYTIIHDKKIEVQQRVSETRRVPRTIQRRTGSGQVQQQVVYHNQTIHRTQTVTRTTIGQLEFSTEIIGNYYQDELELIEIYSRDGQIKQVTIEELIRGSVNDGDSENSNQDEQ